MSRVSELIDLIVQGKNAEASDVLNSELLSRSYEAINDFKPNVAADYFDAVVNYSSSNEEEVEEQPEESTEEEYYEDETD